MSNSKTKGWLWTSDSVQKTSIDALIRFLDEHLKSEHEITLISKPTLINTLKSHFMDQNLINVVDKMSMLTYDCIQTTFQKKVEGTLEKPSLDDLMIIASFFKGFMKDCFDYDRTMAQMEDTARHFISADDFYVWKNQGEIVCMGNIAHRSERHVRLNEIYTPPLHRKKGYAGALVNALCKQIIEKGKIPMFYTDKSVQASNKAYSNVGFKLKGQVDEIQISLLE
ncbi:GNAT family N-acetyltransferase [Fusibacter ferrireducens]|uniref:GNAT family N-acetyltransferase n=1 Tax=Fusibacter ferrireducens TaxID=2785058 RepID=A0ABR9ZN54_9FIRM|nr:GNAT family N-acetyltransferase [Fusibacter ferrireducens]MBF4691895.1 GNAT family N-acetyltransferase [Fusibacter ferrireducens]